MKRHAISTDQAPQPLGPYSQAIVADGWVFVSGTAGIDPSTGVAPAGVQEQTEQALRNLEAILTAAGASMASLVRTTLYYGSIDDYTAMNAAYERAMPDPPPARSAPANVRLPHGLLVSIDAIALVGPSGLDDSGDRSDS
jgi:2-iminobutanoate/2-iminopropanoate deaminase